MRKFRIVMGALALVVVAATIFACTKNKETNVAQQATETEEVTRKPIATYDNATGQMTYHFDLIEMQKDIRKVLSSKTNQDRFVLESVQMLDTNPNNSSVYPEVKAVILDTETETAYTMWYMKQYVEKRVLPNDTKYYLDPSVQNGTYDFATFEGDRLFVMSVNGDNVSVDEVDPLSYGCRPRWFIVCEATNCEGHCEKTGTFWNADCSSSQCPSGGTCTRKSAPWIGPVISGTAAIAVALIGALLG